MIHKRCRRSIRSIGNDEHRTPSPKLRVNRLLAGLALLVLGAGFIGCGGTASENDSSDPPRLVGRAVPPVKIGGTPVAIAADDSGVWAVDNSGGFLVRLDPRRPQGAKERIPIPGGPASVAIGEDGVWVASGSGSITRVNPANGQAKQLELRVSAPGGIAAGEGSVWVTSSAANAVVRIDPVSGKTVGDPIDVGESPSDIAVGDGSVWVANTPDGTVSRIDPESGDVADTIEVADEQVLALTYGEGAVWVVKSDDRLAGSIQVVRIDPDSAEIDGDPAEVDAAIPVRITAGEGGVWVTLIGGPRPQKAEQEPAVAMIDPATGLAAKETVPVGERPSGIATGAGAVWVADAGDGTVTRIDPRP